MRNNKKPFKKSFKKGREQPALISFDESSRKDYLTGFHKRKVEKRKKKEQAIIAHAKEEKRESRREKMRKTAAVYADVEKIEAVSGGIASRRAGNDDDDDDGEETTPGQDEDKKVEVIPIPTSRKIVTVTVQPFSMDDNDEKEDARGITNDTTEASPSIVSKKKKVTGKAAAAPVGKPSEIRNLKHRKQK